MITISNNALVRLRSHRDLITEKSRKEFVKLKEAIIDNYDIEHANNIYTRLCDFSHTQLILSEISNEITLSPDEVPEFKVGAEILYKALDRKSTRLNSSHTDISRMPSSA